MNSKTNKKSESYRFKLDLTDKINFKHPKKHDFSQFDVFVTPGKASSQNTTTANSKVWHQLDIFDLPDGSYSIENIQKYFEFIIKKQETLSENPPVQIYPNKIRNRIIFKIKMCHKLELLTPETMRLLGSTEKGADKDKGGKKVPKLQSVEVVKVLFTFAPNKKFGQVINISPHSLKMMNTGNIEFSSVEVWFTDQASKALEIKDNINLALIIGQTL